MSKNDPAFPVTFDPGLAEFDQLQYSGLTVRQWMIGQVAAGWQWTKLSLPVTSDDAKNLRTFEIEEVVRRADALLAEEERTRDAAESS